MDIRQFQTLITLINHDFNISRTADKLFLVQSAVSQQLKKLEDELGHSLFIRKGKRLIGLNDFGLQVEQQVRDILLSVNNIQLLAEERHHKGQGELRIGCTHTQARYVLPPVIRQFNIDFPNIELQIHQGNPQQLVEWCINDTVDFAICTEALAKSGQLETLPCYQWNRFLITRPGHPLQEKSTISLQDLSRYPIITYTNGFTGRANLSETFRRSDINANIVLSAADSDIIKAYVKDDMGIGIIAGMSFDTDADQPLQARDLGHLFPWETTRIAYLKDRYIRSYQRVFIDLFLRIIRQDRSSRFRTDFS